LRELKHINPIAWEGSMKYEPNNILSRIQWCRHQQLLPSVTRQEREEWRAEEDGLVDALSHSDRTAFMRENPGSQATRYQRGFEDGKALLRLSLFSLEGMTCMEGLDVARSTTPARVNRRPSQALSPMHVEPRR
jgi:hypothetical protein